MSKHVKNAFFMTAAYAAAFVLVGVALDRIKIPYIYGVSHYIAIAIMAIIGGIFATSKKVNLFDLVAGSAITLIAFSLMAAVSQDLLVTYAPDLEYTETIVYYVSCWCAYLIVSVTYK